MKTLKITATGDLEVADGRFQTITGSEKIVQDLGLALKEPFGDDRFHPRWGSLMPSYIGDPITPTLPVTLQAEVNRVVGNYIQLQQILLNEDARLGNRPRLNASGIVASIDGVFVQQIADKIYLRVTLTTLGGNQVSLSTTVA